MDQLNCSALPVKENQHPIDSIKIGDHGLQNITNVNKLEIDCNLKSDKKEINEINNLFQNTSSSFIANQSDTIANINPKDCRDGKNAFKEDESIQILGNSKENDKQVLYIKTYTPTYVYTYICI